MFKFTSLVKTIKKQGERIIEQNKKIQAQKETISDLCEENAVLYAENKELRFENDELILNKDKAERKNIDYARLIKNIADELNTNQYNSVLNLQNKIKSMLSVGKHASTL